MKGPSRRKVSYVLEDGDQECAHRLGVNSLAIDTNAQQAGDESWHGGMLFSAGRDGVVAGWDLHLPLRKPAHGYESKVDLERTQQSAPKATCRFFSQTHTDWVNDIVVCQQGQCVVSASSDRTIKVWRPYSSDNAIHTIGWHTDYAKCLATARQAGWVASGGFDRIISIWDIEAGQSSLAINTGTLAQENAEHAANHNLLSKASIYALAVNPTGTLIASGSPEKVVRLWDPRSGKAVGKLTGHTDNIRALLVSDDGHHILSGSSDSTIKLWSTRSQRCLTTYETHADSIWSLYSDHPELKTFYAGSRDGMVTRTEVSGQDVADESECIGLFKEDSGVTKIAALGDTYVWTATSKSSINRWLSIPPRKSRQIPRSKFNPEIPSSAVIKLPPLKLSFHPQMTTDSLVASDSLTMYAGSVISVPISFQDDDDSSTESLVPLRTAPDSVIKGKPGIVQHHLLPNRRHVLARDANDDVSLWDLINCVQIKSFGKQKLDTVAQEIGGPETYPSWCTVDTKIGTITVQLDGSTCFDCEMYADEADLPESYPIREDQRINLGKWVLSNLFANYVKTIIQQQKSSKPTNEEADASNEAAPDGTTKAASITEKSNQRASNGVTLSQRDTLKPPSTAITTDMDTTRMATSPVSSIYTGPFTAPPATQQQADYFSGSHYRPPPKDNGIRPPPPAALPQTPTSPTSANFMSRLRHLSVRKVSKNEDMAGQPEQGQPRSGQSARSSDGSNAAAGESSDGSAGNVQEQPAPDNTDKAKTGSGEPSEENGRHYTPPDVEECPPLDIPGSTRLIIIAEESAEASTGMDLYRGTVATAGKDAEAIAKIAPSWLLTFLYYNKIPAKEALKLPFTLRPYPGSSLLELPGGTTNRLLANRLLRAHKLIQYVAEKLDLGSSQAVNQIELLCGETLIEPTMTLGTIKQQIQKTGGDIILYYRLKKEAPSVSTT